MLRRSLIGRMGRYHGIDELARMERICLELTEESRMPGGTARVGRKLRSRGREKDCG